MADANPTEFMSAKEAAALADSLSRYGGKYSLTTRLARMSRNAGRRRVLSVPCCGMVHSSDVFQLPPKE